MDGLFRQCDLLELPVVSKTYYDRNCSIVYMTILEAADLHLLVLKRGRTTNLTVRVNWVLSTGLMM